MINRENGRGGEEERKWFVDAGEERADIKEWRCTDSLEGKEQS